MSMLLRRQMMRKAGGDWRDLYQQVAYLQSSGTQYIDTGWKPDIDTEFYVDFSDLVSQSTSYIWVGGYTHSGANCTAGANVNSQNNVYTSFGNKNDVSYKRSSSPFGDRVKWSISKTGVVDNGTQVVALSNVTFGTANHSICLFAMIGSNGTVGRYVAVKIHECIISESGTEVRHLLPCYRKSDSKPGMYDTVSGTFYTNAGTGEFIIPT